MKQENTLNCTTIWHQPCWNLQPHDQEKSARPQWAKFSFWDFSAATVTKICHADAKRAPSQRLCHEPDLAQSRSMFWLIPAQPSTIGGLYNYTQITALLRYICSSLFCSLFHSPQPHSEHLLLKNGSMFNGNGRSWRCWEVSSTETSWTFSCWRLRNNSSVWMPRFREKNSPQPNYSFTHLQAHFHQRQKLGAKFWAFWDYCLVEDCIWPEMLWQLWQRGVTPFEIFQGFQSLSSVVFPVIEKWGGYSGSY